MLPFDQIAEAYYPEKSDAVKNKYKTGAESQELKQYFKAWYSMFQMRFAGKWKLARSCGQNFLCLHN